MVALAWVDGRESTLSEAVIPLDDPGFWHGHSAFESLVAVGGKTRDGEAHLVRLESSAGLLDVPWPGREVIVGDLKAALARMPDARLRVTLTRGGRRIVVASPLDVARFHAPVRVATAPHTDEAHAAAKHGSRIRHALAVSRRGVDDVVWVDADGRFTEAANSAVLASIDGALWTAPWDGRILPSTTVASLVRRALHLGIPVVRRGALLSGPFDALYLASATRDLAPVVSLDGREMRGFDPVGSALAAAYGED